MINIYKIKILTLRRLLSAISLLSLKGVPTALTQPCPFLNYHRLLIQMFSHFSLEGSPRIFSPLECASQLVNSSLLSSFRTYRLWCLWWCPGSCRGSTHFAAWLRSTFCSLRRRTKTGFSCIPRLQVNSRLHLLALSCFAPEGFALDALLSVSCVVWVCVAISG